MTRKTWNLARGSMVWVLILTQLTSVSTSAANLPHSISSLSINKTGRWRASDEAIYPELVRSVQKWVENIDNLDVKVSLSSKVINKNNLGLDKIRLSLSEASERLRQSLLKGANAEASKILLVEMKNIRREASGQSDLGQEIQISLVTEAAYYFSVNDLSSAKAALERAIKINPIGEVPNLSNWEETDSVAFSLDAFESFLSKIQSAQVRSCQVIVQTNVVPTHIKINGFSLGRGREFDLIPGDAHHLEVQAVGYEAQKERVICRGPGKKTISVELKKLKQPVLFGETDLNLDSQTKSMILIEPVKDYFKLSLYTPGRDIDEIPLIQPLKSSSLASDFRNSTGPIATDAAIAVFEKHKLLASNLKTDVLNSSSDRALFYQSDNQLNSQNSWLNSPLFWGVVGGIVLGGAIAYFANHHKTNTVGSDWE